MKTNEKIPAKKLGIAAACIAAALALFILGMALLPQTLQMQMTLSGTGGTVLPKLLGLLVPLAITVICSVLYCIGENSAKNLVGSVLGLVLFGLVFLMNRPL